MKKWFKCPKKQAKQCSSTGYSRDHAVKHRHNRWCDIAEGNLCPSCEEIKIGAGEKLKWQ